MYVEFMKSFHLAYLNKLVAVRFNSAFWAQKRFDSYFLDMMYIEFMKSFHLACWKKLAAVRLISASWAQNVSFLLSRHDVRRVHEKFSSRRFEQANAF